MVVMEERMKADVGEMADLDPADRRAFLVAYDIRVTPNAEGTACDIAGLPLPAHDVPIIRPRRVDFRGS